MNEKTGQQIFQVTNLVSCWHELQKENSPKCRQDLCTPPLPRLHKQTQKVCIRPH